MMISKKPMENKKGFLFDSFLVQRGTLTAEIDGFLTGCTHLSAETILPYEGEYESYEGQNK